MLHALLVKQRRATDKKLTSTICRGITEQQVFDTATCQLLLVAQVAKLACIACARTETKQRDPRTAALTAQSVNPRPSPSLSSNHHSCACKRGMGCNLVSVFPDGHPELRAFPSCDASFSVRNSAFFNPLSTYPLSTSWVKRCKSACQPRKSLSSIINLTINHRVPPDTQPQLAPLCRCGPPLNLALERWTLTGGWFVTKNFAEMEDSWRTDLCIYIYDIYKYIYMFIYIYVYTYWTIFLYLAVFCGLFQSFWSQRYFFLLSK